LEALPLRPKTVVPRNPAMYFTLLPGPFAVLAAVRVCGEGENLWGCLFTALVKLPLARDAVPTTVPVTPSRLTVVVMTIVDGPAAGKVHNNFDVPVVE
jgi:hypothetical protein